MKKKKITINFCITPETLERLRKQKRERFITMSSFVEQAIIEKWKRDKF